MDRAYFIKDLITEREYDILRSAVGTMYDYYVQDDGKAWLTDNGKNVDTHYQAAPIDRIDNFIAKLLCDRYGIEFGQHIFIGSRLGAGVTPHRDHSKRNCLLNFPLYTASKTFIGYADKEGKETVQEFVYNKPCILNTSDWHGAKHNGDTPQVVYQISTSQTMEEVVGILRTKGLLIENE
jgi:hypothetical protein